MALDDKWLRRQYLAYNTRFFHDLLPLDLEIRFAPVEKANAGEIDSYGDTGQPFRISISPYLKKLRRYTKIVLLHEMIHVSVGNQEKKHHGPLFKKERKRLLDAGAFTPLL